MLRSFLSSPAQAPYLYAEPMLSVQSKRVVSRDFAQESPSSWLRRVLLFQKIYFALLVLRDPRDPEELWGWVLLPRVLNLWQGLGRALHLCLSNVASGWYKTPWIQASFGCADLISRFTTVAKLLTAWSFDEAKACEPRLNLGTWSLQQRASEKSQEASTTKLYR